MPSVKTIAVNLVARTNAFESGLARGKASLDRFGAQTEKTLVQMQKLGRQFARGAMEKTAYLAKLTELKRNLAAAKEGFGSYGNAMARAEAIMRPLELASERHARTMRELNQLKKIGALTELQYSRAVAATTSEYRRSSLVRMGRGRTGPGAVAGAAGGFGAAEASPLARIAQGAAYGTVSMEAITSGFSKLGAGPTAGLIAFSLAMAKLIRTTANYGEQVKQTSEAIDKRLLAASNRLNSSWKQLKTSSSSMWQSMASSMAPITSMLSDMLSGFGTMIGWGGKVLDIFSSRTTTRRTPAQGKSLFAQSIERMQANDVAMSQARESRIQSRMLEEDAKKAEEWKTKWDDTLKHWDDRADVFRNKFTVALTPMQEYQSNLAEINDLYDKGRLSLVERNRFLQSETMAYEKGRQQRVAASVSGVLDWVAKRRAGIANSLQREVAAGPATLYRGTSEAFSAFNAARKSQDNAAKQLEIQKKMEAHLAAIAKRGLTLAEATL